MSAQSKETKPRGLFEVFFQQVFEAHVFPRLNEVDVFLLGLAEPLLQTRLMSACDRTARDNPFDFQKHVYPVSRDDLCAKAALHGYLNVFQWARREGFPVRDRSSICLAAAKVGTMCSHKCPA